jgi:threonine synthase
MMALLMAHVRQNESGKLMVLTATSGDTGSAIASAFLNMDNIRVVVLFPRDEISNQQRKQMTTLGKNIQPIAIEGKFDNCQALVKQAFADPDLTHLNLTSANSINIGRLLPQSVYYFWAFTHSGFSPDEPVIFSIPSGNFGNACGCLIAKKMGLPVSKLVLPTNSNDSFPRFLKTGMYRKIEPSIPCISSAMNVGHPSNLARIIALYGGIMDEEGNLIKKPDFDSMTGDIFSVSISERETRETIHRIYREFGILLEPHGAVGMAGLQHFLAGELNQPGQGHRIISLETAHPAKFPEEIREILSLEPHQPESFIELVRKEEVFDMMDRKYQTFKEYLLSNK